ncbi:MAG: hypothetical protein QG670_1837 [Thermoproteota archaeon]|nr:hypothetical protein [Thermoproteota archaeon]
MVVSLAAEKQSNWYFAYFPYGIAFGIFSALSPLYLVEVLGGSLFDLGVMTAIATLLGIPISIFFGQLPDRYGRTKPFILVAFLSLGLLFFFIAEVRSIFLFQILYVLVAIADALHPASTSVLIAESYQKKNWGTAFSRYNFVVGVAQAIGLGACSLFIKDIGYSTLLLIGCPLTFASFLIALIAVEEPPLYVERWLSRLEKPIDEVSSFSYQFGSQNYYSAGGGRSLHMGDGPQIFRLCLGFTLFSLAGTCAFTSLSIFLTRDVHLLASMVFTVLFFRSLAGTLSYIAIGKWIRGRNGEAAVSTASGLRVFLVLLLTTVPFFSADLSPIIATIILSAIAFSWSLFSVGRSTVIMECASEGSLGIYDALADLGGMAGGLMGGFIPAIYGFNTLFLLASTIFALTFILFIKRFGR